MDLSRRRFFGSRSRRIAPFQPPWSLPEGEFVDVCSRCDECVERCPTGLLRRGDDGFPVADFAAAVCTFCQECAAACATRAISPEVVQPPWPFTVRIDDACLARQRVECRVCGEACAASDSRAIRFVPVVGGVSLPHIDDAACTACGACLSPCPVGAIARVPLDGRSSAFSVEPS